MKYSGIKRPVDKMGRVVIPKEIRAQLNIENDVDSFDIFMEGDSIILKKHRPACFFCGGLKQMINLDGYNICYDCIDRILNLQQQQDEAENEE